MNPNKFPEDYDPPRGDGWGWFNPTGETIHLVPPDSITSLCGMNVSRRDEPEERRVEAPRVHRWPLPYDEPATLCKRCRASFAREVFGEARTVLSDLSEGDGVIFWKGRPTDPSYVMPTVDRGIISEMPPLKMFSKSDRRETVTIEDKVEVQIGFMSFTNVSPGRVIHHVPAAGDDYKDAGISERMADMMG